MSTLTKEALKERNKMLVKYKEQYGAKALEELRTDKNGLSIFNALAQLIIDNK